MLPLLRFTLDLFEQSNPAAAPAYPASTESHPVPAEPFKPGENLRDTIAPVQFAHPAANREVRIGDAVIAYAFSRAKRRTIGFVIGPEGLSVRAPRWTPLTEVEAALQEKGRWILRKLQETHERQQIQEESRIVWADGVCLPYLGETVRVQLDPAHGFKGRGAHLTTDAGEPTCSVLQVALPHTASTEQIRDAVQAWLMQQALAYFKGRMDHFAPLLQVRWTKLRLSSAGTRWGSASADGSIRLNWRLIHFRPAVIDYVVAHELSHLRVMDHSASFWDTVATVVPDYAHLRRQLKDQPAPRW
jgi:predicted metal-dependent hydrolase